jgi:hypothetical protein
VHMSTSECGRPWCVTCAPHEQVKGACAAVQGHMPCPTCSWKVPFIHAAAPSCWFPAASHALTLPAVLCAHVHPLCSSASGMKGLATVSEGVGEERAVSVVAKGSAPPRT